MGTELKYVILDTSVGWMGLLSSSRGLLRTTLPQPSAEEARRLLGAKHAIESPQPFESLSQRLRAYFKGHKVSFPDSLDLSLATTFQRRVWEATKLIPYGETRSYRWVANEIGKPGASRAAGQALARNPLPIIVPCHRVLASNGQTGGYTGGVEMKKYLLSLEGNASAGLVTLCQP